MQFNVIPPGQHSLANTSTIHEVYHNVDNELLVECTNYNLGVSVTCGQLLFFDKTVYHGLTVGKY